MPNQLHPSGQAAATHILVDQDSHDCLGRSRPRARTSAASRSRSDSMSGHVVRDVVEGLADRLHGHAVVEGELLRRIRVGTVHGFINNGGSDAATLDEELVIVGAGRGSRCWYRVLGDVAMAVP